MKTRAPAVRKACLTFWKSPKEPILSNPNNPWTNRMGK
jgi:hypothetical protein